MDIGLITWFIDKVLAMVRWAWTKGGPTRVEAPPLVFEAYSGGRSVETDTRLYEWNFSLPIENSSEAKGVGIRHLSLRVKRGNTQKDLPAKEFQEPYLLPHQKITLQIYFMSGGGLEGIPGNEEVTDETATILITDTWGNQYEIACGRYTTNV